MGRVRNLVLVLGDQLNRDSSAFDGFDPARDMIWMAEAHEEATHVWSSQIRIALFLSAMRHFAQQLSAEGCPLEYTRLEAAQQDSLAQQLALALQAHRPAAVILTQPGDWRVLEALRAACEAAAVPLELRPDRHFYTTPEQFRQHAEGRKSVRMEYFYRELRRRFDVLMEEGQPMGGEWNYDSQNRGNFGAAGPSDPGAGPQFKPDATTREVLELVGARYAEHPGNLAAFAWPVTPDDARRALREFIQQRLPQFGQYQDAMWTQEPWLYHSLISAALNLKLLDPRDVVAAAEAAYRQGHAPLAAVEGFIRQILGWREYVRGIYWMHMPDYLQRNAMQATEPLPDFYWTAATELTCLQQALRQTLDHGYAHHIQRLMVTGLYALLLGVAPRQLHEWYLAVYVDAVEWVELPNTLGMSQYADGGLMASKPYVASGSYINRMSNYCAQCPKDPKLKTGPKACPFTTLYWDYLIRHEPTLWQNHRMGLQLRNLKRLDGDEREKIQETAARIRKNPGCGVGSATL